ncbi:hypothetical protein SAMN04489712_105286 [Thermomonospora echinospora]|uniref:Uncharacterized protein n=1 Tax=Thermomonospora echinospora TaxID=1992 RepID=A0A1H6A8N4_9ACTN|nr:hypothetical protein [Thermomonospora echinospora]SEG45098.1 hypothetical protein SAMN04489712_105286 [Thermomonospora echinospora]
MARSYPSRSSRPGVYRPASRRAFRPRPVVPPLNVTDVTAGPAAEAYTAGSAVVETVAGGLTQMPRLIVEVAFASGASTVSSYLTVDDPTRGLIGVGKIAPAGGGGDSSQDPVWTDITDWVLSGTIRRDSGRIDSPVVRYEPGTCTIALDNSDRRFDPTNAAGPYVDGDGVTQVRPMRAVRVRAVWDDEYYELFRGYVDEWGITWEDPGWSTAVLTATDAMKVLRNIKRIPVAATGTGDTTSTRIGRILDSIAWDPGDRLIGSGSVTVQATTLEGDALAELQLTADTELGELYVDGGGRVVFRGRAAATSEDRSRLAQAVFSDGDDGLTYHNLAISADHETMFNRVRITRVGGSEQNALDSVSVTEYFERTYQRDDLVMQTDAQALAYAQYVLALARAPELRFTELAVEPTADPAGLYPHALGRQIGDRINVTRRPPGGGAPITRDVWIRGITHEFDDSTWRTRWTLQQALDGVAPPPQLSPPGLDRRHHVRIRRTPALRAARRRPVPLPSRRG